MTTIALEETEKSFNKEDVSKAELKLAAASCQLLCSVAFFASPLIKMRRYAEPGVPTMGTDGRDLFYNPDFVNSLTISEIGFVILHEIFHYMLSHPFRCGSRIPFAWNVACDYAINTMLTDAVSFAKLHKKNPESKISWPVMPEGVLYDKAYNGMTADQIYDKLMKDAGDNIGSIVKSLNYGSSESFKDGLVDDHKKWHDKEDVSNSDNKKKELENEWRDQLTQSVHDMQKSCGSVPAGFERIFSEILKPKKNWRAILQEFIVPEPNDYGFAPPDKRFSDLDFFLPDLCDENGGSVKNGYFWIDTSGSVSDKEIRAFYSEIVGAMDQFKGKLSGKLGFFDSKTYGPQEFVSIDDIKRITPRGGGGTSFQIVFDQMKKSFDIRDAQFIVMLTDGYCDFPKEAVAEGVPVLWVITTNVEAPWGKMVHLDPYNM